jgi:hypothetical protein
MHLCNLASDVLPRRGLFHISLGASEKLIRECSGEIALCLVRGVSVGYWFALSGFASTIIVIAHVPGSA